MGEGGWDTETGVLGIEGGGGEWGQRAQSGGDKGWVEAMAGTGVTGRAGVCKARVGG